MELEEDPAVAATRARARGYARVALTVAARMAEQAQHRRAEQWRAAEAQGRERLAAVERAQREEAAATRAELRGTVRHPEWWARASEEEVAYSWATARAWADTDGELRGTARWLGGEIERRYGVDPEELWRRVEAQAADRRTQQTQQAQQQRGRDRETAVALVTSADRADAQAQPEQQRASVTELGRRDPVWAAWDTAHRRQALADRLTEAGVGEEARAARLLADAAQATPPAAAVTARPQPSAGRAVGPRRVQPDRQRERGR